MTAGQDGADPTAHRRLPYLHSTVWRSPTPSGRGYFWPETSAREVQKRRRASVRTDAPTVDRVTVGRRDIPRAGRQPLRPVLVGAAAATLTLIYNVPHLHLDHVVGSCGKQTGGCFIHGAGPQERVTPINRVSIWTVTKHAGREAAAGGRVVLSDYQLQDTYGPNVTTRCSLP